MKKLLLLPAIICFTILLLIFIPAGSEAQVLREMRLLDKAQKIDNEIVARRDLNGNYCAAIKVVSDMDGFSYDAFDGVVGEVDARPGLDIVYLTTSERVFEIYKTGYKPLRIILSEAGIHLKPGEVWQISVAGDEQVIALPVTLRFYPIEAKLYINDELRSKSNTYSLPVGNHRIRIEMEGYETIDEVISVDEQNVFYEWSMKGKQTQWMVITSQPIGADVYLNEELKGQTPLQLNIELGTYRYSIRFDLYYNYEGTIELTGRTRGDIVALLKPNFGFIRVTTKPEAGASVLINGMPQTQATPVTSERLKSGVYTVSVSKNMFHPISREITVEDEKTTDVVIDMKPAFGMLYINSAPESGAQVSVNGNPAGMVTPCEIPSLPSGEHIISVRKEWFMPSSKTITMSDGENQTLNFEMQPNYALLNVAVDPDAEIYVNDQLKGTGNWEGRVGAGWQIIEVKKEKHASETKKIEAKIGESYNLRVTPKPITGSLSVQTNPHDASIELNGKYYGTTPVNLNDLLIGAYQLVLSKTGYGTVTREVGITENQVTKVSESLQQGATILIKSTPLGGAVTINGKSYGKTPATADLTFGTYKVQVELNNNKTEQTIEVKPKGAVEFNILLAQKVRFKTNPWGARISVDLDDKGETPLTVPLLSGDYAIRAELSGYRTRNRYISVKDKAKTVNINMKPATIWGVGFILPGEGCEGGVEIFISGKVEFGASLYGPKAMYNVPYSEYDVFGYSLNLGYRIPYPLDFSVHAGYGGRSFTNKDYEEEYEKFNSFILGVTLPLYITRKGGLYVKADYWFETEDKGILLYTIGLFGRAGGK